uniref:Uncharacterized protein n=1 Tax=Oscillatoriales cyanobacterium SpSt-418 TaxID=2282169 RepID=A0A7C3KFW6_9CYAN
MAKRSITSCQSIKMVVAGLAKTYWLSPDIMPKPDPTPITYRLSPGNTMPKTVSMKYLAAIALPVLPFALKT